MRPCKSWQRSLKTSLIGAYLDFNAITVVLWQVRICQRAYRIMMEKIGFNPQDIVFHPKILTAGTGMSEHNNYAVDFIRACKIIKHVCPGAKFSAGVRRYIIYLSFLNILHFPSEETKQSEELSTVHAKLEWIWELLIQFRCGQKSLGILNPKNLTYA